METGNVQGDIENMAVADWANERLPLRAVTAMCSLVQAPKMLQQLQVYGDKASMHLLEVIERDELTHVSSGLRWFKFICEAAQPPMDPIPTFHQIVRDNFRGSLLPPFNTAARAACGFTPEWYEPLAVKKPRPAAVGEAVPAEAKQPVEEKKA